MRSTRWLCLLSVSFLYLTSCSPQPTVEVPGEFKPGQKYFHKTCSNCHGSDAMGKHTKAPGLIDEDFLPGNFSDDDIRQIVIEGTDKMPPQRKKVTDGELLEIIKYLRYSQRAANLVVEDDTEEEESEEEATSQG